MFCLSLLAFIFDKFFLIFSNFVMSSRLCKVVECEGAFKIHSNGFWCHKIRLGGPILVTFGVDGVTIGGLF